MMIALLTLSFVCLQHVSALHCVGECLRADTHALMAGSMAEKDSQWATLGNCNSTSISGGVPCVDGFSGEYPCNNIDLLAYLSIEDLGSFPDSNGNDMWGWEDPLTGREYAITGQRDGTSFVDISDPYNPVVLAFVPSHLEVYLNQSWRDIKTYANHAYIVGDRGQHGLQVFDMTRIRGLEEDYTGITVMEEDAFYFEFGDCHNIHINEDSGYLYCVGSSTCNGGPHMVDISEPKNPQFAGCAGGDGYTHDLQCVNYDGPDGRFEDHEICFAYNEDSLTIYDVTDKEAPCMLSRTVYDGAFYTHQGWLTEDKKYVLMNDELDELRDANHSGFTQTFIWDVSSLTAPIQFSTYFSPAQSIDHNIYIVGEYSYQSNYASGLRVNDISEVADGVLSEAGFFDIRPEGDEIAFFGTWSNYPYYKSGVVAIHSIERGLFLVKPNLPGLGPLAPAIDNLKTQPPRGGPGHGSWPSRGRGRGRGRGRRD